MSNYTSEDQVLEAFNRLSPLGKRRVLSRLIPGLAELDRIVDSNQEHLRALCRERGLDFASLNEQQLEALIDEIVHEAKKD
jgi:hypothetical protein